MPPSTCHAIPTPPPPHFSHQPPTLVLPNLPLHPPTCGATHSLTSYFRTQPTGEFLFPLFFSCLSFKVTVDPCCVVPGLVHGQLHQQQNRQRVQIHRRLRGGRRVENLQPAVQVGRNQPRGVQRLSVLQQDAEQHHRAVQLRDGPRGHPEGAGVGRLPQRLPLHLGRLLRHRPDGGRAGPVGRVCHQPERREHRHQSTQPRHAPDPQHVEHRILKEERR